MDVVEQKYLAEWRLADKDGSGKLSLSEVERLLNKLNLGLKNSEVKKRFSEVDKDGSKELDFKEFCGFLDILYTRVEFKTIFDQYCNNKEFLSAEDLVKFLNHQLESRVTLNAAKDIIKKFGNGNDSLTFERFSSYLVSEENSFFNIEHTKQVYQPMNQPLSHYFISSSHNTYAEAHQLVGVASVEAYITALKRGCKCLELDIWDGDDGNPVITHGHTLLNKIKFKDVILAIRDHGFCISPYPVILSFENHCSERQQIIMAQILADILGNAGMLPGHLFDKVFPLPSPEQLANKVLIKGKVFSPSVEVLASSNSNSNSKKKKHQEVVVAKELSDLAHLQATKFPGFPHNHQNQVWKMYSISEQKINEHYKNTLEHLVKATSEQMIKVYPKGTRFGSSNYDPVVSWSSGCQLVCLNYQTHDEPMWLNTGKFADNGGCGYVLKPRSLTSPSTTTVSPQKLTIKLISGWHLPKETGTIEGGIISPFVRFKLFGTLEDTKKAKSTTVKNDGLNPTWNETFSFELKRPDVAQLIIEVFEYDIRGKNDFLGFNSAPVTSLKSGYRNVPLLNSKSVQLQKASLFIKVQLE